MRQFKIGIAGGSASGKSTFAEALKAALPNAELIHTDSYYKPEDKLPLVQVGDKSYRDYNHPNSLNLPKLHKDLAKAKAQVVIVEGFLVLQDDIIRNQLNLKLFVDCRADERIVRRLRRNMTWGLNFDEIAEFYLDLVRYRHDEFVEPTKWRADMIINGSGDFGKATELIASYIERNVSRETMAETESEA